MKIILLVSNINFVGGIERVVWTLANCFHREFSYDVEVISIYTSSTRHFFEIDKNIKITHGNMKYPKYKNKLKQIHEMDINIRKVLKHKEADIILTFFGDISMSVLRNKKHYKSKIVITEHIDYFECSKKGRIIRNLLYRKADALVVLTKESNRLYSRFIKNVITIPNALSFTTEKKSNSYNKKVIAVGRLNYVKGFDLLIDIFSKVEKKYDGWTLDIIGEGVEKNNLISRIKTYNMEDKINIKEFNKNISEELLNADIYALTSRHEGFGLVLIEAQECGLPCISFNITSAQEIITNGINGIIVEQGDIDGYAKGLAELMESHEKRLIFGDASKENAKNYHINKISLMWKQLFENLVE